MTRLAWEIADRFLPPCPSSGSDSSRIISSNVFIVHFLRSCSIFVCSGDSQSFEEVWEDGCSSRAELYGRRGRDNGNSRPERVWEDHSTNDPLHDSEANIWHRESDGD